jgi:hypothetical protein
MDPINGIPLERFPDYIKATKEHYLLDQKVLNDSARQQYFTFDMISGRDEAEMLQDGKTVRAFLRLRKHSSAKNYRPNARMSPKGIDVLDMIEVPWRFTASNFAYAEETTDLQQGTNQLVDMLMEWRSAARQDIFDFIEESWFADPNAESMEDKSGEDPYSIPCFITDNGMFPAGFSTLQGLADHANYRNQVSTFNHANLSSLEMGFHDMWLKLRWKGPDSREAWFQSSDFRKMKIVTNTQGVKDYIQAMTVTGSRLVPVADPGQYVSNPTYANIPIVNLPVLDEKGWETPKYDWIDGRYIVPIFHRKRFMEEQDPIRGSAEQPFSWVVYNKTYRQIICKSRKRQGRLLHAAP